jgi:hypothetical protein
MHHEVLKHLHMRAKAHAAGYNPLLTLNGCFLLKELPDRCYVEGQSVGSC